MVTYSSPRFASVREVFFKFSLAHSFRIASQASKGTNWILLVEFSSHPISRAYQFRGAETEVQEDNE